MEERGGRERQRWSEERVFSSRFDVDDITRVGWFRFVEKIARNGNDFVFHVFLDLEQMKLYEERVTC